MLSESAQTDNIRNVLLQEQDKLMTESFLVENASCFESSMLTEGSGADVSKTETKDQDHSFTGDINFMAEMEEEESKDAQKRILPVKGTLKLDLDKMAENRLTETFEKMKSERTEG